MVVNEWLHNGIPEGGDRKPLTEVFGVDAIRQTIRSGKLRPEDARRIVEGLKERRLIASATMVGDSASGEGLLSFLSRFWDYDRSPYVREKEAYVIPSDAGTAMSRQNG